MTLHSLAKRRTWQQSENHTISGGFWAKNPSLWLPSEGRSSRLLTAGAIRNRQIRSTKLETCPEPGRIDPRQMRSPSDPNDRNAPNKTPASKVGILRFHPQYRRKNAGCWRVSGLLACVPNKANSLRFCVENEVRGRKQSQSKPIWDGHGSTHIACCMRSSTIPIQGQAQEGRWRLRLPQRTSGCLPRILSKEARIWDKMV